MRRGLNDFARPPPVLWPCDTVSAFKLSKAAYGRETCVHAFAHSFLKRQWTSCERKGKTKRREKKRKEEGE